MNAHPTRREGPPGWIVKEPWTAWLPSMVVALSLLGVALVPRWYEGRIEALRRHQEEVVQPTRDNVDDLQFALAREVAAKRGYILTRESSFLRLYQAAVEQREMAVARLEARSRELGPGVQPAIARVRAATREWHATNEELLTSDPSAETLVARLGASQAAYEASLEAAFELGAATARVGQRLIANVRALESQRRMVVTALLALAVVSTGLVLWVGWRMRRMARQLAAHAERERQARRHAERAVRLREEVLAVVSHDLRSPLSTIAMSADTLRGEGLPQERRLAYIGIIERTAERMSRLIEDLLEVARVDARQALPLDLQPTPVEPLLREGAEVVALAAGARSIDVAIEVPEEGLPTLRLDRERMLRVLGNLLDNAVKFTPEGGRVTLRGTRSDGYVGVEISDTGSGMSEEEIARVFEPFWQGGRGRRGGAGLGTSIARAIVEAHGGQITVGSRPGLGTTFTVRLPERPGGPGG